MTPPISNFPKLGFCHFAMPIRHGWRDTVEEFPSGPIAVEDMTMLRGIIFAPKVIHYCRSALMDSLGEKSVGLGNHRLTRGQPGVESSVRIRNLEPHVGREEKDTITAKAGLAEGIEKMDCEFDTTEIRSEAKETAMPLNRRRKIRVYFPSSAQNHR